MGAIGAGIEVSALLTTLVRDTDVEVLMLPGRYTPLDQSALDGLLPACQECAVRVIAAAVFHPGVLAQNRPGAGAMFGYRTGPSAVLDRANRIAEVYRTCDLSGSLRWLVRMGGRPATSTHTGAGEPVEVYDAGVSGAAGLLLRTRGSVSW